MNNIFVLFLIDHVRCYLAISQITVQNVTMIMSQQYSSVKQRCVMSRSSHNASNLNENTKQLSLLFLILDRR